MSEEAAIDIGNRVAGLSRALMARRVEEASLNAWPPLHQVLLDGWVLRFTRGFTKRANSVTPLYPATQPPLAKVRYCEDLYTREGLRTIFRMTTVAGDGGLDELLADRGYQSVDPTRVLQRSLRTGEFGVAVGFAIVPMSSFLATYARLQEPGAMDARMARAATDLHAAVLRAIRGEVALGVLVEDGEPVACGMVVVEREIAGLFDIVVHPERRRRGFGRSLVGSLLAGAAEAGARQAYLQVVEDNTVARALYEGMGFESLYGYRYRVSGRVPAGG